MLLPCSWKKKLKKKKSKERKKAQKPPALSKQFSSAFCFLILILILLLHTFPANSFREELVGKRELSQHFFSSLVTPAILHKQAEDASYQDLLYIFLFPACCNGKHAELDHSYWFSNSWIEIVVRQDSREDCFIVELSSMVGGWESLSSHNYYAHLEVLAQW